MSKYIVYIVFSLLVIFLLKENFGLKNERDKAMAGQEKILELKKAQEKTSNKADMAKEVAGDDLQSFKNVINRLFD